MNTLLTLFVLFQNPKVFFYTLGETQPLVETCQSWPERTNVLAPRLKDKDLRNGYLGKAGGEFRSPAGAQYFFISESRCNESLGKAKIWKAEQLAPKKSLVHHQNN